MHIITRLIMKNLIFPGLTLLIFLTTTVSSTSAQKKLPKNEYGLTVVSKISDCKCTKKIAGDERLVPLNRYIPGLITDFKYATMENFTGKALYKNPAAYGRQLLAKNLANVQKELEINGLSIKIWDAYRPYSVTKKMWEIVPDERYAANPANGSGHNRGAAVDLTLVDLRTGKELPMPTPFDNFTEKAHHDYQNLPEEVKKNRGLLRSIMEKNGFIALETEWWHYSLPDAAKRFDLLDIPFSVLARSIGR
ncbi:MAG: D-alanyl-D-alanine dipeptidase [Chitinophagaceae bacterium]|nr:D-alanyl-D-alanine dipeptidase [Chitinophagaceae bacterium]